MLRTEKVDGVVHVYARDQHLGQIVYHRGQYHILKDGWSSSMPIGSFKQALDEFRPRRVREFGFRSCLACL